MSSLGLFGGVSPWDIPIVESTDVTPGMGYLVGPSGAQAFVVDPHALPAGWRAHRIVNAALEGREGFGEILRERRRNGWRPTDDDRNGR